MKKNVADLFKTIGDSFLSLSEIYHTANSPNEMKEVPKKKNEPIPTKKLVKEEAKTYSKEEVRATLANKAKIDDGKYKVKVKDIVAKYSSNGTLTNVPADKYQELMNDLEKIEDA